MSVISHLCIGPLEARPHGTLQAMIHPFQEILKRRVSVRSAIIFLGLEVVVIFLILSLQSKNPGRGDQNVKQLGRKLHPFRRFEGTE